MSTIVVPLDGSEFAEAAIRVARAVAHEREGSIRLMEVTTSATFEADDEYLQRVADRIDDVPVTTALVMAEAGHRVADGIARAAEDAGPDALVCMTAHGRSGLGAAVLGSTSEDLLRRLHRPVLVVGRHCSVGWPEQRRLLVPLDGSDRAGQILPEVAGVASDWGLEAWLLQVVHPFDTETSDHVDTAVVDAQARLHDLGVEAKTDFQFASNVALTINHQARSLGAAVIMMSSYVHPGMARTLLGSVTMNVIHGAPCPVLVCPSPDEAIVTSPPD